MSDLPHSVVQQVAHKLRDLGVEETPDQVREIASVVCAKIRKVLWAHGFTVSESDTELLCLIKAIGEYES